MDGPNLPSANEFSNCANGDSGHGGTQVAFELHGDVGRGRFLSRAAPRGKIR
jgi:hypothetical protein